MHLINRRRLLQTETVAPGGHPFLVFPIILQIPDPRGRPWRYLVAESKGVGFINPVTVVTRENMIFVSGRGLHPRDEPGPYPGTASRLQGVHSFLPGIEIPNDRHLLGVGRPDGE